MQVNVVRNIQELIAIKEDWMSLYKLSLCDNVFLSYAWIYNWCNIFAQNEELYICCILDNKKIVAIAPFIKNHKHIKFIIAPLYADFAGILIDPNFHDAVQVIFANSILADCIALNSGALIKQELITFYEKICIKAKYYCQKRFFTESPYIKLHGSFDDYLKSRGKKLNQELRTTVNHLKKMGDLQFIHSSDYSKESENFFAGLVDLHKRRQDNKIGNSIFANINAVKFFEALIKEQDEPWKICLSAITLNEKIISVAYSIRQGDTYFYCIPSFDNEIKKVSLGKLHIKFLIQYCFSQGITKFDFMGGQEKYKYQWTADKYGIYTISANKYFIGFVANLFSFKLRNFLVGIKSKSTLLQKIWLGYSKHTILK